MSASVKLSFAAALDKGRVRDENQDAVHLPSAEPAAEALVFVLADGMGGARGGRTASLMAVETIPAAFGRLFPAAPAQEALIQAVAEANAAIFKKSLAEADLRGMGTTVVALAVLSDGRAVLANAGDSRAYLWRGGKLIQITQDHSLVAERVRQGELSPEQARHHGLRNILTRAVGVEANVAVDAFGLRLAPADGLILCSDGLHGPVDDAELARILADGRPPDDLAQVLVAEANGRGGPDNISVIVVKVDEAPEVEEEDDPGETTVQTRKTSWWRKVLG